MRAATPGAFGRRELRAAGPLPATRLRTCDNSMAISFLSARHPDQSCVTCNGSGRQRNSSAVSRAEQAFRSAQQDHPISAEWHGDLGTSLRQAGPTRPSSRFTVRYRLTPRLRCWRCPSVGAAHRTWSAFWPPPFEGPDVYWGAISFFVNAGDADQAVFVWKRLVTAKTSLDLKKAYPLLELLIKQGRASDVQDMWKRRCGLRLQRGLWSRWVRHLGWWL